MFEKDAEEWANRMYPCDGQAQRYLLMGTKFGYNKAKEEYTIELKEIVETCNHWQEVAEKVNKWHYVKDELPDEGTYLVVWQNNKGYKEIFIMNYEENDEEELHWIDGDCEVQDEYVIAWKELPGFPKESK